MTWDELLEENKRYKTALELISKRKASSTVPNAPIEYQMQDTAKEALGIEFD